ncbi:hypothetical protein RhiirC2_798552 [Rhizophagus irregularis]|uniref:Uncharacterized protein n=1 Tax=Rhizophagus irregularis TaxID=588596 RepID=A0A2N1M6D5_9GLOM|nr:hypothetical protein RhiirC2_798552 [Rhizophagus irregularis]
MKIADKTEEYYSDPKSGMESVDNDDDDDYVYSSESSSCEMNDSDKWIFSTGKIVEDALYNFDPNNKIYINKEVFTKIELDEI